MNQNSRNQAITHVGLDVHKKTIAVAVLLPDRDEPRQWQIDNTEKARRKLARELKRLAPGPLLCVYEAGPTGFSTQRQLEKLGLECKVAAPGGIARKPSQRRKKNDKRDALMLAEALRGKTMDFVVPPTPEEEAARDLCRALRMAVKDQTRARNRVGKLLLKQAVIYTGGQNWTRRHQQWLLGLSLADPLHQVVLEHYLLSLEHLGGRITALRSKIEGVSHEPRYAEKAGWLRCYRGIDTVTAMLILTELHGAERFASARQMMSYCGLLPGEDSSGERVRRGPIDKAGNAHLRWALVESAWHYRHSERVGKPLQLRRAGQPEWVIAQADRALRRGHTRFVKFKAKDKPSNKAVVAVARELAGFLWATLHGPAQAARVERSSTSPPKPQAQHHRKS